MVEQLGHTRHECTLPSRPIPPRPLSPPPRLTVIRLVPPRVVSCDIPCRRFVFVSPIACFSLCCSKLHCVFSSFMFLIILFVCVYVSIVMCNVCVTFLLSYQYQLASSKNFPGANDSTFVSYVQGREHLRTFGQAS